MNLEIPSPLRGRNHPLAQNGGSFPPPPPYPCRRPVFYCEIINNPPYMLLLVRVQSSFRTERDTSRLRCIAVRRSHTCSFWLRVPLPHHRVIFAVCWRLLSGEASAMTPTLFLRVATSMSDLSALSFVSSMSWIFVAQTPMAFEICPRCSFTAALCCKNRQNQFKCRCPGSSVSWYA